MAVSEADLLFSLGGQALFNTVDKVYTVSSCLEVLSAVKWKAFVSNP